jgi:membrane-bound lytic murein transglycosylase D
MTTQASLLLLAVSVFSGVGVATAASPEVLSALPSPLEEAAIPPSPDPFDAPADLSVERTAPAAGSDTATPHAAPQVDATVVADGWAEAFAEAARLQARTRVSVPAYPLVINSRVQYFIDRFTTNRREVVSRWFNRSGQYLGMIRETLRNKGLPEELAFVAMIESGFNPLAVSRAGAKGLWQFMAGTARQYGLRVDQWVDERLDPEKSTNAAAAYFRDLYQQFGSWALAKAAYNAGDVKVVNAMRAVGSNDFWILARSRFLKPETKEFVPAIHAATVIGRDPARYGFEPADRTVPETTTVVAPPRTSLRALATASGVSFDTLRSLNPVLIRATTPPSGPYNLRVPTASVERINVALAEPSKLIEPKKTVVAVRAKPHRAVGSVHVVRQRDTMSSIAKLYGISITDLLRWNRLDPDDVIRPGDRLRVAAAR